MKKILFGLAFFCAASHAMDDNDKKIHEYYTAYKDALYQYKELQIPTHPWNEFRDRLLTLSTITPQHMTNLLIAILNEDDYHVISDSIKETAYDIILLWKEKIDFNLLGCSFKKRNWSTGYTFHYFPLSLILDAYCGCIPRELIGFTDSTHLPEKLYHLISRQFKDKVNVNLLHPRHKLTALTTIVNEIPIITHLVPHCSPHLHIRFKLVDLLEDFLKNFTDTLSAENVMSALQMCHNKSYCGLHNHCRMLIEGYYPKKLRFNAPKIETLHNCHFHYVYCPL